MGSSNLTLVQLGMNLKFLNRENKSGTMWRSKRHPEFRRSHWENYRSYTTKKHKRNMQRYVISYAYIIFIFIWFFLFMYKCICNMLYCLFTYMSMKNFKKCFKNVNITATPDTTSTNDKCLLKQQLLYVRLLISWNLI